MRRIFLYGFLILATFLSGCASLQEINSALQVVDRAFREDYDSTEDVYRRRIVFGTRDDVYQMTKESLLQLGFVVTHEWRSDGIISTQAQAPTPLTEQEWKRVVSVEDARIKALSGGKVYFLADPKQYKVFLRADIKNLPRGVALVTLTFSTDNDFMRSRGLYPLKYPPPTATELATTKFWTTLNKKSQSLGLQSLRIPSADDFNPSKPAALAEVNTNVQITSQSSQGTVEQELKTSLISAERDRLAIEVETERKKRQEVEAQLNKERERVAVAQAQTAIQPAVSPMTIRSAHALVIGNAAYPGSFRLDNPLNDATAISQKLRSMGFMVTTVTDANRQRLVQAMTQFRRTAASSDLSVLFYSGHGVQIFGQNYILPTDVDQTDVAQATIQGVSLNNVVESFLPGKTKLVFLDACRDNPLQRTSDRSVSKGLAPISVAQGTLIAYATKDGQTASDGPGQKNSPFTQALLQHLSDPTDIGVVLRRVREKVMQATGGKQQPWDYGSLTGGELVLARIGK